MLDAIAILGDSDILGVCHGSGVLECTMSRRAS
jgi:hypothetical protein